MMHTFITWEPGANGEKTRRNFRIQNMRAQHAFSLASLLHFIFFDAGMSLANLISRARVLNEHISITSNPFGFI